MRSKQLRSILARVSVATLTLSSIFTYAPGLALATGTSATVDHGLTTTVNPSDSVRVDFHVYTTGGGSSNDWYSTGWKFSQSGSFNCVDTPNHDSSGGHDEHFSITAPPTVGTYKLYLKAYHSNDCSGGGQEFNLDRAVTVVSPTCTSFTYTDSGPCLPDGTMAQSVVSSLPAGCVGGTPVATHSCVYIPPTCTEFTYADSGECTPDGTMAQSVISSLPAGCVGGTPAATHACIYTPPAPEKGSIEITKYVCPATTVVTRSENGVDKVVPEGCVRQAGAKFAYVHGDQSDALSPYPELDASVTPGGVTNSDGVLVISDLAISGRYLVVETNSDNQILPAGDILGLYCEGDGDQTGTNDNQELTFLSTEKPARCVAYNKQVAPPEPQCNPEASQTIVSDTTNTVNGEGNALLTWTHTAWANLAGASWIWSEAQVSDPTLEHTNVFTKSFNVVGTVTAASLDIAADNGYKIEINGTVLDDKLTIERNYNPATNYDVTGLLKTGTNALKFTVTNFALAGADYMHNPAGLLYKLTVHNNECFTPPPPQPTSGNVKICKYNNARQPLSGWSVLLKGELVQGGLTVPSNVSSGVNSNVLEAGRSYIAKVNGTWTNQGGANVVDAEYSTTDNWASHMDGYTGYQNDILELQINNAFDPNSNWGVYNSAHTYVQSFIQTTAAPANFRVFDGTGTTQNEGWFGDNSGSLTVDIYRGYAGITREDGCVTFKDVPFGSYSVDEIMQDNWVNVSGVGDVTVSGPELTVDLVNQPKTVVVHIFKYINGEQATSESAGGVNFPMYTSTYSAPFTLGPAGWTTGDIAYEASTGAMAGGSPYSAQENVSTDLVSSECDGLHPYALLGYTTGDTLAEAQNSEPSSVVPSFSNLQGDKYIIVWNTKCKVLPTLKVHIQKYVDGRLANAEMVNGYQFPMTATWQTSNLNGGVETSGSYALGNGYGGASEMYGANTAEMKAPANYATAEVTGGESLVLPTDSECAVGKYRLLGYKTSENSFENALVSATSTNVSFTELSSDRYVIVMNETCKSSNDHDNDGDNSDHDSDDLKRLSFVGGGGGAFVAPEPPILGNPPAKSVFLPGSTTEIEVTFDVKNAIMMLVSEDKNFAMMGWAPFSTTTRFTLSPTNLDKKFYIRFRSASGGETRTVELTAGSTGHVLGVKVTRLDELVAKLEYGDRGAEVRELQTLLKNLGYFSKYFRPTTWYGPMTRAAVQKYLASKGV